MNWAEPKRLTRPQPCRAEPRRLTWPRPCVGSSIHTCGRNGTHGQGSRHRFVSLERRPRWLLAFWRNRARKTDGLRSGFWPSLIDVFCLGFWRGGQWPRDCEPTGPSEYGLGIAREEGSHQGFPKACPNKAYRGLVSRGTTERSGFDKSIVC